MAAGSQSQLEHKVHLECKIHLLSPLTHAVDGCTPFQDRRNIFSRAKPEQQMLDWFSSEQKS